MTKANSLKDLVILLDQFERIPKSDISSPTFMEIAGFPHYENVCSNILAFYFNTQEAHSLGDLFVKSTLNCLKIDSSELDLSTIEVHREFYTNKQNRIDLLIECEDVLIIIENKIWASIEHNNLEDYTKSALEEYNKKYDPPKELIKIVLSLYKIEQPELEKKIQESQYTNITHKQLLSEIRKNLGERITMANIKYLNFLTDFMESMDNHTEPDAINKEFLEFMINEKERIGELLEEKKKIDDFIYNKAKEISGMVTSVEDREDVNQWIWRKYDLIHDIKMSDEVVVSIDCYFEVDGITIGVWVRKGDVDKVEYLKAFQLYKDGYKLDGEWLSVQSKEEMSLLTPNKEIVEKLNEVIKKVS